MTSRDVSTSRTVSVDRQHHHRPVIGHPGDGDVLVAVVELPLPLEALYVDGHVGVVAQRVDLVLHRVREAEQHEHDHDRDDGVDDLERDDVLPLARHVVATTAPVAEHREDDERQHDRADDERGHHATPPEVGHRSTLLGGGFVLSERGVAAGERERGRRPRTLHMLGTGLPTASDAEATGIAGARWDRSPPRAGRD